MRHESDAGELTGHVVAARTKGHVKGQRFYGQEEWRFKAFRYNRRIGGSFESHSKYRPTKSSRAQSFRRPRFCASPQKPAYQDV